MGDGMSDAARARREQDEQYDFLASLVEALESKDEAAHRGFVEKWGSWFGGVEKLQTYRENLTKGDVAAWARLVVRSLPHARSYGDKLRDRLITLSPFKDGGLPVVFLSGQYETPFLHGLSASELEHAVTSLAREKAGGKIPAGEGRLLMIKVEVVSVDSFKKEGW